MTNKSIPASSLPQFKPDELVFNDEQTRQILRHFFAKDNPTARQAIEDANMTHELKSFAQSIYIYCAMKSMEKEEEVAKPLVTAIWHGVKAALSYGEGNWPKAAKHGYELTQDILEASKALFKDRDIKNLEERGIRENDRFMIRSNFQRAFEELTNPFLSQAPQQPLQTTQTIHSPEPKEPTLTEKLQALASNYDSQTQRFAKIIEDPDKWQKLPETLDKTDGRHTVLMAYLNQNQNFSAQNQDNQEKILQMFVQHINEAVTEREVNIAAVKIDRGMDFGRG